MLIGVKNRFIFVANTKTASTSIEHALAPTAEIMRGGGPQFKHMPISAIQRDYWFLFNHKRFGFDTFFRFAVMRDPMSWIDSWFRYRRGNDVASPLPAKMTFEEFWKARDWNIQNAKGHKYLQSNLFTDDAGTLLTDVIIPYERMDTLLPRILEKLGYRGKLPRKNISELREPSDIPPSLRDELRTFYAKDYAIYDRLDALNAVGMEKLEQMTQKA